MGTEKEAVESGDKHPAMRFLKLLGQILIWIADGRRNLTDMLRMLQLVNDRPDFVSVLDASRPASVNTDTPADGWSSEWTRFYAEVFGSTVDLSGVRIPDDPGGFGRVVFVVKELTYNHVYAKCHALFPSSSYYGDDLDCVIIKEKEERTADDGPYAVRFRNCVEPDNKNKNTSANTLAERQTQNITLLEAMLLELWYYWRTGGGHLNFVNLCLCPGSHYHDGHVPYVDRYYDKFHVGRCNPGDAAGSLRSRSAVRLPLNPSVL